MGHEIIKTHHPPGHASTFVILGRQTVASVLALIADAFHLRLTWLLAERSAEAWLTLTGSSHGVTGCSILTTTLLEAHGAVLTGRTSFLAHFTAPSIIALAFPIDGITGRSIAAFAVVIALWSPFGRRTF
jgi:hypothetical protein